MAQMEERLVATRANTWLEGAAGGIGGASSAVATRANTWLEGNFTGSWLILAAGCNSREYVA